MKISTCLKVVLALCLLCESAFAMEVSRNNHVDWVLASARGTSTNPPSNFVQWKEPIHSSCTDYRTKFSSDDKEIFSLLLSAKMSNKKVGLYYELTATTPPVPGHGTSECQIVNVWFESE